MTSSGDLSSVGRLSLVAGVAALLCLAAPEVDSAVAEDREQVTVTSPAGVIGLPRGAAACGSGSRRRRSRSSGPRRLRRSAACCAPRPHPRACRRGSSRSGRASAAPRGGTRPPTKQRSRGSEVEARSQRRHLARIAAAVRRRGGAVREVELVPGAVVASLSRSRARSMARLPYVQAVEGAPRPRSLSGIGTSAIGAPSWWAAGLTGGTGSADTVPADAAIESEAADPTHPAFTGHRRRQRPDAVGDRPRYAYRRDHRLR